MNSVYLRAAEVAFKEEYSYDLCIQTGCPLSEYDELTAKFDEYFGEEWYTPEHRVIALLMMHQIANDK